jgi:tRNA 2-thiouridine synthesizing protein D
MKFTLHITSAPYSSESNHTALHFARAALANGHQIVRVFFMADGVHSASDLCIAPQDEINIPAAWQQLASQHGIDLVVCVSSALRRGIIDATEAQRYDKTQHAMNNAFVISGLGQLVDAIMCSDRMISFGG